jgi:hypothetical protein
MEWNQHQVRYEARLVARAMPAGSATRRRVFTWRNFVRSRPRIADQPACPLQVLRPRFYSHASIGSRIGTSLRFHLRNVSGKAIHSYYWRHASPVREANGGFGCAPDGGLGPDAQHEESAWLAWPGLITITIDFVQFHDGEIWLSSDSASSVTRTGVEVGCRRAADHLLHIWQSGGAEGVADALPRIHRDVTETPAELRARGDRPGTAGFYAGVTRAAVMAANVPADQIEAALVQLRSVSA